MREPVVGATADGRLQGQSFQRQSGSLAGVRVRGPISTLQSLPRSIIAAFVMAGRSRWNFQTLFSGIKNQYANGYAGADIRSVGLQQLQLNSLSLNTLLDAKAHPENYKNLIVRVWGWTVISASCPEYQDHIIARHLYEII